ncbi:MAG: 30S ribosome-binding factor RbfA [Candidatus Coatesbacteria bacterium]|nr:30S ribosome-binding factor RbfA [Candidatus Coatesbacteria bacterium]
MPTYSRSDRMEHQIQKEICDLLLRRVKDPRVELITITSVRVTPDLRQARILYTMPRQEECHADDIKKGLDSATGFIRSELGRRLRVRRVPQIEFVKDDLYEQAISVADTIARLERERKQDPEDEP